MRVETIKETVTKDAETVKDFAAHASQKVSSAAKDIHIKTEARFVYASLAWGIVKLIEIESNRKDSETL